MTFKMGKRRKTVSGSLTVEAALGLTLFVLFSVCMMMPMEMLRTRQKVQTVLEVTAREMSQYAYILYRLDQGDDTVLEESENWEKELSGLLAGMAVRAYLREKIEGIAGKERIENLRITEASLMEDGENIILAAEYDLKIPFSVFHISRIQASSRTARRAWIGSEGDRNRGKETEKAEEVMVYIGSSMGRYHLSRKCHYLTNEFRAVSYESIENLRNQSGGKYYSCSVCGKACGAGDTVYIMPNGSHYHSRTDCPSVVSYVREVPLSQAEHLGACSYCGGNKT